MRDEPKPAAFVPPAPPSDLVPAGDYRPPAPGNVFVKHKGGAGGFVHEFNWDFNASDTIEVDRATAEDAVKKYADVFEIVPAPGVGK